MAADTGVGLTPAEFFHLGSGDISPLVPIQFLRWTPNYSGAGYVVIPAWQMPKNFEISVSVLSNSTNDSHVLSADSVDRSWRGIERSSSGTYQWRGVQGDANGLIEVASGEGLLTINFSSSETPTALTGRPLSTIGAILASSAPGLIMRQFDGQIHSIRLTDLDTPANSRFYRSVISSETMPDSLVLVDDLGEPQEDTRLLDWRAANRGTLVSESNNGRTITVSSSEINNANGALTVAQSLTAGQAYRYVCDNNEVTLSVFNDDFSQLSVGRSGVNTFIAPSNQVLLYVAPKQVNQNQVCNIGLFEVTDGVLTDFPATQKWVPLLGTNQAYLSGRDDVGFVNGLRTSDNTMSAIDPTIGLNGSWFNNQPAIGSLLLSGDSVLQVVTTPGIHNITYAIANGTDDQIQRAFQYPNVFDIDPFDSATEAYLGTGPNGFNYVRGIDLVRSNMSAVGSISPSVVGSFFGNRDSQIPIGSVLTANNGFSVFVNSHVGNNSFNFTRITGTPEQIQQGFQWPNHFTVTSP